MPRRPAGLRRARSGQRRPRRAPGGPSRITATGLRLRLLGSALMRDFYERFWADAPPTPSRGPGSAGVRCCSARPSPGSASSTSAAGPAASSPRSATRARTRSASRSPRPRSSAPARSAPGADLRLLEPDGSVPLEHGVGRSRLVLGGARARCRRLGASERGAARPAASAGGCSVTVPVPRTREGRSRSRSLRFDAHFDPQGQHLRFFTRGSLGALGCAPWASEPVSIGAVGGLPLLRESLVARAGRSP